MKKTLIAVAALMTLAGCTAHAKSGGEDSGVVRCRRIALNLASTSPTAEVPTKGQIAAVRTDFSGSRYDDLRAAGINYADAAEALFYGTGQDKGTLVDAAERQSLLASSCRAHGVAMPTPAGVGDRPTLEVPPPPPPTMAYVQPK